MNIIKSENSKLKRAKIALCKMVIFPENACMKVDGCRTSSKVPVFCFVLFCFVLFDFVCSFFWGFFVKLSYYLTWGKLPGE